MQLKIVENELNIVWFNVIEAQEEKCEYKICIAYIKAKKILIFWKNKKGDITKLLCNQSVVNVHN